MANPLADSYLNESTKLDGENYVNWKFKIITVLEAYNLWPIVKGDETKPRPPTATQDWEKREMKARVLLRMSVKDNIIPHVRDCETSKATWDTLKGLYETTNANRILFLKTKLLSIKMDANESISNFVSRIKDFSDKLGDIGEKVSSTDLVTVALKGLVPDYKVFISALSARPTPPTFEELAGILLQEEERMKIFDLESNGSDLALTARGKRPFQGRPWDRNRGCFQAKQKGMAPPDSYVKRNIECDYCGKPGHLAKDCYRRKNNESNQRHNKHNGNYINRDTSVNDGFKNLKLFLSDVALSAETDDENAWFIDSGASAHMTCNKEWYQGWRIIQIGCDSEAPCCIDIPRDIDNRIMASQESALKYSDLIQGCEYKIKRHLTPIVNLIGINNSSPVATYPLRKMVLLERWNRTLVESARSMLQGKNISNGFWAEAINAAVYLKNRCPTKQLVFQTPFEVLYGYKPDVSHFKVFGCTAFAHIPKANKRKLDAKSIKCVFIGYCTDQIV
eukprot:PITA_20335